MIKIVVDRTIRGRKRNWHSHQKIPKICFLLNENIFNLMKQKEFLNVANLSCMFYKNSFYLRICSNLIWKRKLKNILLKKSLLIIYSGHIE